MCANTHIPDNPKREGCTPDKELSSATVPEKGELDRTSYRGVGTTTSALLQETQSPHHLRPSTERVERCASSSGWSKDPGASRECENGAAASQSRQERGEQKSRNFSHVNGNAYERKPFISVILKKNISQYKLGYSVSVVMTLCEVRIQRQELFLVLGWSQVGLEAE